MSLSFSVRNMLDPGFRHRPRQTTRNRQETDKLLHVAARLWLDQNGARLYDHDAGQTLEESLALADPEACAALRAALPEPGDYLGDVLLLARLGFGEGGLEIHTAYWIVLGELTDEDTVWRAELKIAVRPAPLGYSLERGGARN